MEAGEEYTKHMGQYPVIFLSLKSAKQPTYEMAYLSLANEIRKEYDSLKMAVVTGCLRISRESIFTGLNNLDIDPCLMKIMQNILASRSMKLTSFLTLII